MEHARESSKKLAVLSAAERRLANCTDLEDVMQVRDQAEILRHLAQKQRRSLQLQNRAAKLKIQAERRIGQSLAEMNLRGGDNRKSKSHDGTLILHLKDLGISRHQSSHWQREASVSNEEFEAYCREIETEGKEISSSAFLRFIQSKQRNPRCLHRRGKKLIAERPNLTESAKCLTESLIEVEGHIGSIRRMFLAICQRPSIALEPVERQEIPRYLHEIVERLDEMDDQLRRTCE